MRVDFYQLSRDPAEAVLPLIARNTLKAGERLLVVAADPGLRARASEALWTRLPESFLAHGEAGGAHDARQPILLAEALEAANGAKYLALADGAWREGAEAFERVFYLFGPEGTESARACWRALRGREGVDRKYWKQEGGRWVEAG